MTETATRHLDRREFVQGTLSGQGAEYMADLARSAGSWPGYRFTSAPLTLPAAGSGLGHGTA